MERTLVYRRYFRHAFALAFLALTFMSAGLPVNAQEFPTKPIRLLVHVVGGVPDLMTRLIGQSMSSTFGRSVVVENRPGGGGLIAVQELLKSAPDGHTLLCVDISHWAIFPALQPGRYDPVKDFAPIGTVATSILFIAASDKVPVTSIEELIALAKAKPGTLSYGSSGNGSIHHLFMEVFKAHHGIDILHVPFSSGATAALTGLLSGSIQVVVASHAVTNPHVKSGHVKRLVTITQKRSPFAPDVPSLADLKMPDDFTAFVGYVARAGAPKATIDQLAGALAKAVQSPEFTPKVEGMGLEVNYRSSEQFGEIIRADVPRYARAVKIAGIKVD